MKRCWFFLPHLRLKSIKSPDNNSYSLENRDFMNRPLVDFFLVYIFFSKYKADET